jgi:hypothetical protein
MRRRRVCVLAAFSVLAACAHPHSPGVGPQYDSTHVYVEPSQVDAFVASFLATFGGTTTAPLVATVTPSPSSTTTQLLQTPAGMVSLFGFTTPIPYPFGSERTGYLVRDLDQALDAARAAGADVIVESFPDAIGRDAVIQWPGGVDMQLYWHTSPPSYPALATVPENRVYVSAGRADAFVRSFVMFARGRVVADDVRAPGIEIGRTGETFRKIRIESSFGKLVVLVTDGHLPYPYGRELTGYEVRDLAATIETARRSGARVLVEPFTSGDRDAAMIEFPGGYIAEVHGVHGSGR